MSDIVWAKVYLELPNDPKLVGRSAHDCYLWVCLILLAKANGEQPGVIPAWQSRAAYLAKYARISLKETTTALAYFEDVGMLRTDSTGILMLSHFGKRQSKSDPTASKRQREKRAKDRGVTEMSRVTNAVPERDSHDTRAREEADSNPYGLQEADPLNPPAGDWDEGVCGIDQDLGAFGEGPSDQRPPRVPVLTSAGPITKRDEAFDAFKAEYPANPDGTSWSWYNGRKQWQEHVPPGDEAACMEKLALYKASSSVANRHVRAPANWLPGWREQVPGMAPVEDKPAYTVPGQRRPDGKIQVAL